MAASVSASPKVFLVAECVDQERCSANDVAASFCVTTASQVEDILDSLRTSGFEASSISDCQQLARFRTDGTSFVIFPHWHGSEHRNRRTTVTGVCEAFSLPYVGADSYLRSICGDKHLSKKLAQEYEFLTPQVLRIHNVEDDRYSSSFPFPAIVKPNYLGASVGIDNSNIAASPAKARDIVARLRAKGFSSLVLEQYISGREVTLSCYHADNGNIRLRAGERYVREEPDFFVNNVYDTSWKYSRKFFDTDIRKHRSPPRDVVNAVEAFMRAECPKSYCRFDFRVNDKGWYLMEITPDPLMTRSSEFLLTLTRNGCDLREVFRGIVLQASRDRGRSVCAAPIQRAEGRLVHS